MSKYVALVLILVVTATAAAVGGCGGGDDYDVVANTTVTTASIPKQGYVERVNRICRRSWTTIFDNFARHSRLQDPGEPARRRFADAIRNSLLAGIVFHIFDNIHNLGAPKGEARQVEEIIGTMQSASERGQKGLAPVTSIAQVEELYADYNELARAYGFDDCLVDEARLRSLAPSRINPAGRSPQSR